MVVGQFRRKSDRILCVKFHDYVASTETVLGQVCTFLTIEFEPTMLEAPVARNTSFKVNEQERTTILDKGDDFFINIIYWLIGTMMPVTYRLFPKFKLGYAKSASLPHWFFKMFDRLPQIDEEGS